jgi:uncharacterized protein
MPDTPRARELIERLQLSPHPERGYFAETYRATLRVEPLSAGARPRAASTAIYFLVTAEQPTTFLHRLRFDEVFHLYEGGPLHVLQLFEDGSCANSVLGLTVDSGERPQLAIPAGTWFGTTLAPGVSHCLIGCTVAPGFEFEDFELDDGQHLEERYPSVATQIRSMSRSSQLR